jgi:RNA polymerase sigma factor (sigma-70 family)
MEREEFENWIESIYDPLLRFAIFRCRDSHWAQDLVQDACLSMWRANNQRGDDIEWSTAYAMTTLSNIHRDHLRKEAARQRLLENVKRTTLPTVHEDDHDKRAADRVRILRILQEMPERHKEIYLLHEFVGFTPTEIADLIGVGTRTVQNYLSKARAFVAKVISGLTSQQ